MDKKKILLVLFILVAIVQISFSASMIINREITLKSGKQFKFRTAPVDPYDAFRGRYVALDLEEEDREVPVSEDEDYTLSQTVYAIIKEDEEGFARIKTIQTERPDHDNYIKTWIYMLSKNTVWLRIPFNRFYMDEFEAPRAEEAYRESNRSGDSETYITVRVKSGSGVIEGLYIDNKHIREYIKEEIE